MLADRCHLVAHMVGLGDFGVDGVLIVEPGGCAGGFTRRILQCTQVELPATL
jgi:hypothetical protein